MARGSSKRGDAAAAEGGDFLLEIGFEEMPARFVPAAIRDLERIVRSGLEEIRLASGGVRVYGTPRRLTVIAERVEGQQRYETKIFIGPPRKVAFDAEGRPTKAAEGFARRVGVPVEKLATKGAGDAERLCAEVRDPGRPAVEVLPAAIREWVEKLDFPKSMVWNDTGFRFARPIRWVLAMLGSRPLAVEMAGVKSGTVTMGRRFHSGEVRVPSAAEYVDRLREAGVVVDQAERRRIIEEGLEKVCSELGGRAVRDDGLMEEVTFLVEHPTVAAGRFDPSYTEMPRDVVVTAMREHQRYFAVEGEDGSLLPYFVTVLNTSAEAVEEAVRGNERVLEARLADARFYWELDLRRGLEALLEGLKGVVWHEGFGTLYDKSRRLAELSSYLAGLWCPSERETTERAALMCKADLASEMVKDGKEFTGLQGAIGGEYALRWGEPPAVASAIKEHYLPRFAGDGIPKTPPGAALSVADKVDDIVGGFAAGKAPTGSEDPYALRRAANGIIRILLETPLRVSMSGVFEKACELLSEYLGDRRDEVLRDVTAYWVSRGDSYFAEKNVPYDIADAVLSVSFDDPVDSWNRCRALARFREDEDFEALVIGFKRAANILRKADEASELEVDRSLLDHEAERALDRAVTEATAEVERALAAANYERAIEVQLGLRPAIDRFFDDVLVMDEDPRVRATRLALLDRVRRLFLKTWDLSKIALEGE